MSAALLVAAYLFIALAYLVALYNIIGTVDAHVRGRHYSQVPLISILFVLFAGLLAGERINRWIAFAAVIIDPGTWVIVLLPPYLALRGWRSIRGRCPICGYDLRGLSSDQKSEVSQSGRERVCPECGAAR